MTKKKIPPKSTNGMIDSRTHFHSAGDSKPDKGLGNSEHVPPKPNNPAIVNHI